MPVVQFLVDVSAWVRYPVPEVAARLDELGTSGALATCDLVELQLLAALESADTYTTVAGLRRQAYPVLGMRETDVQRALELQALLGGSGEFSVSWATLLVAAIAERHGVTVLHSSWCFDVVARTTGHAVEWVVPPGMEKPETTPLPPPSYPTTSAKPSTGSATATMRTNTPARGR
jgi:predicted nucleic acid-binding protein